MIIERTHVTRIVVIGDRRWTFTDKGEYGVVWSGVKGMPLKFQGFWQKKKGESNKHSKRI